MQQDSDAYRRGVAEGLRLAAEALDDRKMMCHEKMNDTDLPNKIREIYSERLYVLVQVSEDLAAFGPVVPPLPPDGLLHEYEKMRAVLREIADNTSCLMAKLKAVAALEEQP